MLACLVDCSSALASCPQWLPDPLCLHCACGRVSETVRTHPYVMWLSIKMQDIYWLLSFCNCNTCLVNHPHLTGSIDARLSLRVKWSLASRISLTRARNEYCLQSNRLPAAHCTIHFVVIHDGCFQNLSSIFALSKHRYSSLHMFALILCDSCQCLPLRSNKMKHHAPLGRNIPPHL